MEKPILHNCQLIPRKTGDILFGVETDKDLIHPYLDGYTILPNEEYEKLLKLKNFHDPSTTLKCFQQ